MTDAERELIQHLVDAGWRRESVEAAVLGDDWTLLRHTGRVKVRLEPSRGEG